MVAKGWKNWSFREVDKQLVNGSSYNIQVALFCLVPDIVWWQISSPDDVVNILQYHMVLVRS